MVSVDTISKINSIYMEWALLIAAIVGSVIAAGGTYLTTSSINKKQHEQDLQMAELNKQNELEVQKTMFDYQNNFNSWSNNRSQMVEAGLNPALMYGGTSPVTFGASGSTSGSSSPLHTPDFSRMFKSVDPFEVASQKIARQNADTNTDVGASVVKRNEAEALESASRTARHTFDLGLQKKLEKTIIDQSLANLERTSADTANLKSIARERDTLLAGRVLELDRTNQKLLNDIEREPLVRKQLLADTNRLRALTKLASEQASTEGYRRSQIVSDIRATEESLKGSQLERIMKMTGISKRHSASDSYRLVEKNGNYVVTDFTNQEKQAFTMLVQAGYSLNDATTAVLYYSGVQPKDLTPSVINGVSRVLGGLTK